MFPGPENGQRRVAVALSGGTRRRRGAATRMRASAKGPRARAASWGLLSRGLHGGLSSGLWDVSIGHAG